MAITILLLLSLLAPATSPALAADAPGTATAPVVVDGVTLFRVRGLSAYPADERASVIADRVRAAAADRGAAIDTLRVVPGERSSDIVMGDDPIMSVFEADAEVEGFHRDDLARWYARRIRGAVSLAATVVLAGAVLVLIRFWRRLNLILESRYTRRLRSLEIQSVQVIHAERLREAVRTALRVVRALVILGLAYLYLSFVLTRFPWTRPAAARLLGYVLAPLATMAGGVLTHLPNLVFLVILVLVTRYVLKIVALVFTSLERGTITFAGFEREWAVPTYRILRIAVIGFAAVIAYPYIPGSESAAFKGMSIFFGLLFSLGASSVVANMMAGYSLIYRRTFKVGDRVKINDVVGDVVAMRLQVTHLRTIKNEDVIVPNSVILTSQVVNYSTYAAREGLILHTTVGIGYEVPWRQVEAMLLLAASRTPDLQAVPSPFVLQTSLGDFAVNYELNAYCGDSHGMAARYTALHRNIQDVFNEYGVQIMTPAYESDPASPKVVPPDQWYQEPARSLEEFPRKAAS